MKLKQLRERLATLTGQATAKRAELKDDTVAADATRIEGEHAAILRDIEQVKGEIATEEQAEAAAARAQPVQVDPAAMQTAAQEAIRADRERGDAIRTLGTRVGQAAFAAEHANKGTSLADFRGLLIDKLATAEGHRTFPHLSTDVRVLSDETDVRRLGMVDALVARLTRSTARRGQKVDIPEHARAYGEMGLVELAAEAIGHRGTIRTVQQVNAVLTRAIHTTSDFPAIFMDAMNKRLINRYQIATPTYRLFSALDKSPDFRAKNVIRAGDFPSLQPVSEAGEIKHATFSESKEQFRVFPYGVRFNVSRVMIINDDLQAIDQLVGSYGDTVTNWENVKVFEVLNAGTGDGPILLTDNKRMFHTDHGNKAAVAAAIDVTSVGGGRAAMMKQKSLDGLLLNLMPTVILTGPDKITQAEQLVTSITPAQISSLQRTGCLVNTIGSELSRQGGFQRASVGILGRKETKLVATGGGAPPAILARFPILNVEPVLKMDTVVVADVISVSWTYDNKATPQDYLGDVEGYPTGHDLDAMATFSGSIRARFRTAALYDMAKANTAFAMELLWQRTAARSFSLQAPVVRLSPTSLPVTGPGRIEQSFNFTAEQTDVAAMLVAVLKNGTAAAAYV